MWGMGKCVFIDCRLSFNVYFLAIAPGQGSKLLKLLRDNDDNRDNVDSSHNLQAVVVNLYMDSSDRSFKKQLLSMIVNSHTKSNLQQLIPGLTTYAIDEARKHAVQYGMGEKL